MGKDWIIVLLFSACCGALVGTGVGTALGYPLTTSLFSSAAAGVGIGIVGRLLSELVYRRIGTWPIASFATVFVVIGMGTVAFSLCFGVHSARWIALMTAAAEVIGLGFSLAVYRYSLRLNRKLQETQALIRDEGDKAT